MCVNSVAVSMCTYMFVFTCVYFIFVHRFMHMNVCADCIYACIFLCTYVHGLTCMCMSA